MAKESAARMKYPRRGKKVTYHGRSGRPLLHKDTAGKIYIMTRKKGGGTKRVYVDTTKPNYGLAKRKPKRR